MKRKTCSVTVVGGVAVVDFDLPHPDNSVDDVYFGMKTRWKRYKCLTFLGHASSAVRYDGCDPSNHERAREVIPHLTTPGWSPCCTY